jgi:Uma2 family endonuclease
MELQLDLERQYTYADYLTWLDDKRRELINGFVKLMSPVASKMHQLISGNLHGILWDYLRQKNCRVFHPPFEVRIIEKGKKEDNEIKTVLQPDIFIVRDMAKLDEKGCLGTPDMVIEIVTPFSAKKDTKDKYNIYEQAGVNEYWLVYPHEQTVHVFVLSES